ncbi:hypothetical protein GCM10023318_31840 [Nocardia callitridis]|uniref:Sensor domain-containing protein n=1 Tax=Nocardia callitridis TaxID=648753 RepID=A0ABP9KBR6_9NOCA
MRRVLPVVFVLVSAGCGANVAGRPVAEVTTVGARHVEAELSTLLPDPTRFPAGYPAVVLSPEAAAQAAGDLTGVGQGATVLPGECAPDHPRTGSDLTAAAVGTDDAARATLTVELTRTEQPLTALRDRVAACAAVRVRRAGAETTVRTELDAPPVANLDDTVALRRTVLPQVHGTGLTQSMMVFVGQFADVRITVAYMTFAETPPDGVALRELFDTAARKVRQS